MENTFDIFETKFLGCFNIGTCLNLFKIILANNSDLSDKQKKDLLDEFGFALKGKKTRTIRKSLDRISQYSAGPSYKSRTKLDNNEIDSTAERLTRFFKENELAWAPNDTVKKIFIYLLSTILKSDPNYWDYRKRYNQKKLKNLTYHFYQQIELNNNFNQSNYYQVLNAYLVELLSNPNRHKFNEQYTLYHDHRHINDLANLRKVTGGGQYTPSQALLDWTNDMTTKYQELTYYLRTTELTLSDLDSLKKPRKAKEKTLTIETLKESLFYQELQFLTNKSMRNNIINVLADVEKPANGFKNALSKHHHFVVMDLNNSQKFICSFINLYSAFKEKYAPDFVFKHAERTPYQTHINEEKISHIIRLETSNNSHLNANVVVFHHYCPSNNTLFYDDIDYYLTRARELLWNSPNEFYKLVPSDCISETEPKFDCVKILESIPTSLTDSLTEETPLYAELSLLIRTSDNFVILDIYTDFYDNSRFLGFSNACPLKFQCDSLSPLKQLQEALITDYNHALDLDHLSNISLGIDCHDYSQQLIYLYDIDMDANDLLDQHKNMKSSLTCQKFAVPFESGLLFQLCRESSVKPALSYSLLKLCQLNDSNRFKFKCWNY